MRCPQITAVSIFLCLTRAAAVAVVGEIRRIGIQHFMAQTAAARVKRRVAAPVEGFRQLCGVSFDVDSLVRRPAHSAPPHPTLSPETGGEETNAYRQIVGADPRAGAGWISGRAKYSGLIRLALTLVGETVAKNSIGRPSRIDPGR